MPTAKGPGDSGPPQFIEVYNAQGKPSKILRSDFREIVVTNLQDAYNEPDRLGGLIHQAILQNFLDEALEPARHLAATAPPEVSLEADTFLGHILHRLGRFAESRDALEAAIRKHGEEPGLLTNLGRALAGLGDKTRAEAVLWRAIELDPDWADALQFLAFGLTPPDGPEARMAVFERAAKMPGNWWALLWQARELVNQQRIGLAISLYREAISRAGDMPARGLEQISGDLGRNGFLREAVDLVGPIFDPAVHGIRAGNNLMMAFVGLGDPARARQVLESLYAVRQPEWQDHFDYWEEELSKVEHRYGPTDSREIRSTLHPVQMPLWTRPDQRIVDLLPNKPERPCHLVALVGSVGKQEPAEGKVVREPPDLAGRLSRAIPAFLADQVAARTDATASLLIALTDDGGFILSGAPTPPEKVRGIAPGSDLAFLIHLEAFETPFILQANLISVADHQSLATWHEIVDETSAATVADKLASDLIRWLGANKGVLLNADKSMLRPPAGPGLTWYLGRLENALAIRSATLNGARSRNLISERSILDALITLVKNEPQNLVSRLLTWATYEGEAIRRPDIGREYFERISTAHGSSDPLVAYQPAFDSYANRAREAFAQHQLDL